MEPTNPTQQPSQPVPPPASSPAFPQPSIPPTRPIPPTPLLLVVAVLLLATFGSLGLFAYQNYFVQKPSPIPTPTRSPTANLSRDEVLRDWKTYTNNALGFSFRYPTDYFKFQEESSSGVYLAPSKGQGGDGPKFLEKTDLWLEISNRTPVDLSPETPKTPVMIGGLSGYKYASDFSAVAGNVRIYFYLGWVLKDNKFYTISLSSWDADVIKGSEKLFDQILSTFNFLGASPTPTCRPRPPCLDSTPRCLIPETNDMCPPSPKPY